MTAAEKTIIKVETTVNTPLKKIWDLWTVPEHIMQWNNASPDWHTPNAENNLIVGGIFNYRMEAKDGSFGFDFGGTYDVIMADSRIEYTMDDGRKAIVEFIADGNQTNITETFESETENSLELQKAGWQAILDNFKKYAESK